MPRLAPTRVLYAGVGAIAVVGCVLAALSAPAGAALDPVPEPTTTTTIVLPEGVPTAPTAEELEATATAALGDPSGFVTGVVRGPPPDGGGEQDPAEDTEEDPQSPPPPPPPDTADAPAAEPTETPAQTPPEDTSAGEEQEPGAVLAKLEVLRQLDGEFTPISEPPVVSVGLPDMFTLVGYVDVPRGPRSTRDVVDALVAAGAGPQDVAEVLAPFPVAGAASYSFDWGAPRHTPTPHPHQGTDIFASRGTPVVATADGVVTGIGRDTLIGGNSLYLETPGATIYYAHLDDFAPGITEGSRVTKATVLGVVGTTGNAAGTRPHLHFEIHPDGGEAVPPLPYLDAWLDHARQKAAAWVTANSAPPWFPRPAGAPAPAAGFFEPAASSDDGSPAGPVLLVALAGIGYSAKRWGRSLRRRIRDTRTAGPGALLARRPQPRRLPADVLSPFVPPPPPVGRVKQPTGEVDERERVLVRR